MTKTNEFYYIPSGITSEICEIIKNRFKNEPLENSKVLDMYRSQNIEDLEESPFRVKEEVRKSQHLWIPTDDWISGMMAHFIHCANNTMYNYDIIQWADRIQYTVYDGKDSYYHWHEDTMSSAFTCIQNLKLIRKLSISLCLSPKDDYEGGEFQVMLGANDMQSIKLDMGDVIVFPSDASHRVRKLKSGKRISLVGWFAGPPFR